MQTCRGRRDEVDATPNGTRRSRTLRNVVQTWLCGAPEPRIRNPSGVDTPSILLRSSGSPVTELKHLLHTITRKFNQSTRCFVAV